MRQTKESADTNLRDEYCSSVSSSEHLTGKSENFPNGPRADMGHPFPHACARSSVFGGGEIRWFDESNNQRANQAQTTWQGKQGNNGQGIGAVEKNLSTYTSATPCASTGKTSNTAGFRNMAGEENRPCVPFHNTGASPSYNRTRHEEATNGQSFNTDPGVSNAGLSSGNGDIQCSVDTDGQQITLVQQKQVQRPPPQPNVFPTYAAVPRRVVGQAPEQYHAPTGLTQAPHTSDGRDVSHRFEPPVQHLPVQNCANNNRAPMMWAVEERAHDLGRTDLINASRTPEKQDGIAPSQPMVFPPSIQPNAVPAFGVRERGPFNAPASGFNPHLSQNQGQGLAWNPQQSGHNAAQQNQTRFANQGNQL